MSRDFYLSIMVSEMNSRKRPTNAESQNKNRKLLTFRNFVFVGLFWLSSSQRPLEIKEIHQHTTGSQGCCRRLIKSYRRINRLAKRNELPKKTNKC
jgi:hypothetical protein